MERTQTQVVVVGAGPGGYAAAFYAADLGKRVILVEKDRRPGGVCLNRGCIPSKALLHATHAVSGARESAHRGVTFEPPKVDLAKLRGWKDSIIDRLSGGIAVLAKQRGVEIWHGRGYFEDSETLRVESEQGQRFIGFEQAIIAVGSRAAMPKAFDLGNPRIMTSDEALEVEEVPERMLVVGGGYIGLELGTVYATLGSQVVIVELLESLLYGADADLVRPVFNYAKNNFSEVRLKAKVQGMATSGRQIQVKMEVEGRTLEELFDRVLVAVGRLPNAHNIGLENTKVACDEKGFIKVNERQQTDDPRIYAIGDIVGGIMLAHKASREGRIAVEAITGDYSGPDKFIIPAVVFTDPEVAWCGLTENEARDRNLTVQVARFSWNASGRALTFDRPEGLTKMIVDPETERILGVGIVGSGAGELISEGVLAVEMGATAKDIALSVHPHPTLSETLMECAEAYYGHATHILARKRSASPAAQPKKQ